MHIFLISSNITNAGGTERIGLGLANELVTRGNEVTIVSLFGTSIPFFEVNENVKIITLFKKERSLFMLFPILIWKLRRIFRRENKKSIILNIGALLSPFTIAANSGTKHKNIIWEHFNVSLVFGSIKEKFARYMACKYGDAIVTLTLKDKEMYLENFNCKSSVYCIPNFLTFPVEIGEVIRGEKVALAVGRLTEQKGFDKLLKMWARLPDHLRDWQLKIVGDGEDYEKLNALINMYKLDNVHLISTTKDVGQYYAEASLYLMTSRWEGLPMVLIEAQSYGLPIISYDCLTGPRDVVQHGLNGFLIPNDLEDMYVQQLIKCMEDGSLREALSATAYIDSRRFDKGKVVDTWNNLFKNWN